jgi:hypothetical protein
MGFIWDLVGLTTAGGIVVGIDWEYMNGNMTTVDMHTHTYI